MKKTLLISLLAAGIFLLTNSFRKASYYYFRSNGAAAHLNAGYTGSALDGGNSCSNCHAGGNYNAAITTTLLSGTEPVTTYVPGNNYTLRIVISATGNPKYGFQTTCASGNGDENINGWGAMPAGTRNSLTSANRNYVEQAQRLDAGTINIPWTAPAAATGTIFFYSIGNAVNGTGSTSGDNPTAPVTLSITEGTLPITLTFFNAVKNYNGILLKWATEQEINHKKFALEHSADGITFTPIAEMISAEPNSQLPKKYQYLHQNLTNGTQFYRLKNVDVDNKFSYSAIVSISWKGKVKTSFILSPNVVTSRLTIPNDIYIDGMNYKIVSSAGLVLQSSQLLQSSIEVSNLPTGNYFLTIETKKGHYITSKFIKL